MIRRLLFSWTAGLWAVSLTNAAIAQQGLQDVRAIEQAALDAVQAGPGAQALVAPELRLRACQQALIATPSAPTVAAVRCPDTPGWRVFVPVRVRGTAENGAKAADTLAAASDQASGSGQIRRGDPVILRARIGNSEVRMAGRALGQATAGNIVSVENDHSHRIIRGRLNADGTVDVIY